MGVEPEYRARGSIFGFSEECYSHTVGRWA